MFVYIEYIMDAFLEKFKHRPAPAPAVKKVAAAASPLTPDQAAAFALVKGGHNMFITGEGGTGKSFLIRHIIKNSANKMVAVTSTTGMSAVQIGGVTIHHFSGARIFNEPVPVIVGRINKNKKQLQRWRKTHVLIIDEISMFPPKSFDMLDEIARQVRRNDKPFGGIQVILSGDMYQLPPVHKGAPLGNQPRYVIQADAWKHITHTVVLKTNMRQIDDVFRGMLNQVRIGNITEEVRAFFEARRGLTPPADLNFIKIYTHNVDVDAINDQMLAQVGTQIKEYKCAIVVNERGKLTDQYLQNNAPCPLSLRLCIGCKVMHLVNTPVSDGGSLVNGSLGSVESFTPAGDPVIKFGSVKHTIAKHTWTIEDDGKPIASYIQYPLKLSYCSTVHKIQGQTFDAAEIDLSRAF
jgi:ATP-dependent DNA helicase PIF1